LTVTFARVALPEVPWDELDARPDRTVFQCRAWLDFLAQTQAAEPVVAEVRRGGGTVGWFTGAIVRRGGLKFLGSPMRGWTTSYMGFNVDELADRTELLRALPGFAFGALGCVHIEVMDRHVTRRDVPGDAGYVVSALGGYERVLDVDDDELMAGMTSRGRRYVRKAHRNGVEVERVDPAAERGFAAEYFAQVVQAFAKRSLVPPYSVERVDAMIRHLHDDGRLVLLRSRDPDGRPVATGLFPGLPGRTALFWMGASHRDAQGLLPNDALMWAAMRTWRDLGAVRMDFGGGGDYKRKYGGEPIEVPWLRRSRFAGMEHARGAAQRAVRAAQVRAGRAR